MSSTTDEAILQSGRIKVIQNLPRKKSWVISDERFESRNDLMKVLFQFKGCPVEVTVIFDEKEDLVASGEP